MTTGEFWSLIDAAAPHTDVDDRIRAVMSQLEGMPDELLAGFRDRLYESLSTLGTDGVYAAGALVSGRVFDELRFESFRALLITKGRDTFDAMIADPDSAALVPWTEQEQELDFETEMLLYAAAFAFQAHHGEDADLDESIPPTVIPTVEIDFEFPGMEALRDRFPKLWPKRRAMIEPKPLDSGA